MIVTFLSPSGNRPIGGVIAVFEFANALARRGHEVHLAHVPSFGLRVEGPADIAWSSFEPSVEHHFVDTVDEHTLPRADFAVSGIGNLPAGVSGLPLVFVMGDPSLLATTGSVYEEPFPKICIAKWLVDLGIERHAGRTTRAHPVGYLARRLSRRHADRASTGANRVSLFELSDQAQRYRAPGPRDRAPPLSRADRQRLRGEPAAGASRLVHLPSVHPDRRSCARLLQRQQHLPLYEHDRGIRDAVAGGNGLRLALVTVANGGSDEFAIDGETAFVCTSTEPELIADRIMTLLADDDLRIAMAEAAALPDEIRLGCRGRDT